jgi:hypothetical protein
MANPYHDKLGRFTTAGRAVMWIGGGAAAASAARAVAMTYSPGLAPFLPTAGQYAALGAAAGAINWGGATLINKGGDVIGRTAARAMNASTKASAKGIKSKG